MNWDTIQGNWKEISGRLKESWAELTDDELLAIEGKRDQIAGLLQKKYGLAKIEAEQKVDEWANGLKETIRSA